MFILKNRHFTFLNHTSHSNFVVDIIFYIYEEIETQTIQKPYLEVLKYFLQFCLTLGPMCFLL